MSHYSNGVAPVWRETGDGAYTIPAGYTCVGFVAEVAGTVNFTSGGTAVTPSVSAGLPYPARVDSFQASSTATGIHALLLKG
jgi:hypothetical protein